MADEDTDDTIRVEVSVSSAAVAREVGWGILGRAQALHENPDDEVEHIAEELRTVAWEVLDRYDGGDDDGE